MIIIILLLSIFPLLYKLFFWLYVIQLKEYRWDRFNEYLHTKQWKNWLIWFLTIFEFPILSLLILALLIPEIFYWIVTIILFYILIIINIFVIWKFIRKKVLKPKITSRLLVLWFTTISILIWIILLLIPINHTIIFIFIFLLFLFFPFFIFFANLLTLPLINYQKNKLINKAILKSKNNKNTIKIWITGSYWKSSIKEFLSTVLEKEYNTLKTPENINTELWVSSIVLNKLNKNNKYFVAEMWAYKIWEIDLLGQIVNHKYGFLTAIWNQHLWLFWSIENTIKAKFEIANKVLENNWVLYLNYDNKYIKDFKLPKWLKTVKYSLSPIKDWAYSTIKNIKNWVIIFDFNYKWKNTEFEVSLNWKHNILNLTWVFAFFVDRWISYSKIKKYTKFFHNTSWSLKSFNKKSNILIDDTYNLSESSLISWISTLNLYNNTKILVVDDILELWKNAEQIHYNIGKKIANKFKLDKILLSGKNNTDDIKKWLLKWWFKKENIIDNLENIKNSTILFEWRNSKKYLDKLN